jgi:hypothetical protein
MQTEDKVRNEAAKILGLEGEFAGTGQISHPTPIKTKHQP